MNSFPYCWLCWLYSFLSFSFFLSNSFPPTCFGIWNRRLIFSGRFVLCPLHSLPIYLSIWHFALGFSWTTRVPHADHTPVAAQGLNPMVILGTLKLTTECWGTWLAGYCLQGYISISLSICHSHRQQSRGAFFQSSFPSEGTPLQLQISSNKPGSGTLPLIGHFEFPVSSPKCIPGEVATWSYHQSIEAPAQEGGRTILARGARSINVFPKGLPLDLEKWGQQKKAQVRISTDKMQPGKQSRA